MRVYIKMQKDLSNVRTTIHEDEEQTVGDVLNHRFRQMILDRLKNHPGFGSKVKTIAIYIRTE